MGGDSILIAAHRWLATLRVQMSEEQAFWICLRLLSYHNLSCLYSSSHPFLSDFLKHFHCYCEKIVPALCQNFVEKGFLTTLYAVEVRQPRTHTHTHTHCTSARYQRSLRPLAWHCAENSSQWRPRIALGYWVGGDWVCW